MQICKLFALLLCCFIVSARTLASGADGSTEKEMRSKIVEHMREIASIEWTASEDVPYWNPKMNFTFKKGETYRGIPYTQSARDTDLDDFKKYLKTENGKSYYVGPTQFNKYVGSDCSSSVSHAWRQASPNFPALSTHQMVPYKPGRIVKSGEYEINAKDDTKAVVKENGFNVMEKAYATLKPGDAVVKRSNGLGHVMLVVKNDPEERRLFIIDQTGVDKGVPLGQNGQSTLRVDKEQSYQKLFNDGYIPIALKEVAEASASATQQ